jgi:DNA-binding response OmpR family regulator
MNRATGGQALPYNQGLMRRAELLVVEDEPEMAAVLTQGFEQDQYAVQVAADGRVALRLAENQRFDVIVLDVMLPGMDGFSVAAALRKAGNKTPVLMLTARDSITDVVLGLDSGAQDYVTKPFSFLELSARVRALIRRSEPPLSLRVAGDLTMDPASHEVQRAGRPIHLTPTEFHVLEVLLDNAGHVVARKELLRAAWGSDASADDNNLDVTMSALRAKIDKGRGPRLIHTVRGFGYKIAES